MLQTEGQCTKCARHGRGIDHDPARVRSAVVDDVVVDEGRRVEKFKTGGKGCHDIHLGVVVGVD